MDAAAVRAWSDDALLEEQRAIASERRRLDARAAVVAAELARRSERAGSDERATIDLVQRLTGASRGESRAFIAAGRMTEPDAPRWLRPVGDAVLDGRLGVAAANAIGIGLGDADPGARLDELEAAAARLTEDATRVPVEHLAGRARVERELLDERGAVEREAARRSRRFLRLVPLADGMTRIVGLLDTESAARVRAAFDQVTAPRRRRPRFATDADRVRDIDRPDGDPRSTEQLLLDRFVELVERAVAADDGTIFGARRPGVRVHVAARDLRAATGIAQVEGSPDAVSVATARRIACTDGVVPIVFDDDREPLDVGRTQRLHTVAQRIAIAARDGGCRWVDCDRPPSWTEVHHPIPWGEGGTTSVANGVSLCAYHHLRLHDERWRIEHRGSEFWLHAPPNEHEHREPVRLPARHRIRA